MLTAQQIEIVKSTVPILQVHGETITKTFYKNMLGENPELKDIFNMANQAKGDQPRSLATSVLAYAANIDKLENLGPAVSLIAHKHCSLDVLPEHYPIVGRNLIRAIGEVLGDAVTPEIADAWTAAYNQLADILIGVEGGMYDENAKRGWAGFKPFRVTAKKVESDVITSFTLVPEDGQPLPVHGAGQYLSVKVQGVGEHVEIRQYTISSAPSPAAYRISVKRESGGLVSNHLHGKVREGDTVLVHMPHGDFVLDETSPRPVAFLSGGVGITPVLAMLERQLAIDTSRPVVFIHAAIDGSTHAFGPYLRELAAKHPQLTSVILYETPREADQSGVHYDRVGRVTADVVKQYVPVEADTYTCGPLGFMGAVDALLADHGVPAERRCREVFGPTLGAL